MFAKKVIGILSLTLFVLPFFSVANARTISRCTGDSTTVSSLLLQAREDVIQLRNDAEELQSFNWSKMSWESHAMKLDQIRDEVNSLGVLVTKLNDQKTKTSPRERQVIDRVTPMLKELASRVQVAIDGVKNNPEHVQTFGYRDDYSAIAEISSKLAAQISDLVQYDQLNAKLEKLARRLEIS